MGPHGRRARELRRVATGAAITDSCRRDLLAGCSARTCDVRLCETQLTTLSSSARRAPLNAARAFHAASEPARARSTRTRLIARAHTLRSERAAATLRERR